MSDTGSDKDRDHGGAESVSGRSSEAMDSNSGAEDAPSPLPLTDREMEVLQCLPTRLSTVDIGATLNISPNTVKTHLRSIYHKLGARSRNEAILKGARYNLISAESQWLVRH